MSDGNTDRPRRNGASDDAAVRDGLRLIKAFQKITSDQDRAAVIALAEMLARRHGYRA